MPQFALISPTNIINRFASNIDPSVETKVGWRWLPVSMGQHPAFDDKTEIVEGPVYSVQQATVVGTFTKRLLTAQELNAAAEAKIDRVDLLTLRVLFNAENRIRVLEGRPAVTMADYRTALKALL